MYGTLRIPSVTGIDVELRIAGPGGRSYAFIVDWHIRVLVAVAWMLISGALYLGSVLLFPALAATRSDFVFIVILPAAGLYLLYHPVLEVTMRGRTPGKRIAGVRIVRRDGGIPGAGPLLLRNLFRLVDSLPVFYLVGLTVTLLTKQSVRVGDIAAGTLLIYDDAGAGSFDDAPSSRGIERLGLERAELVRDLLLRWPELRPATRADLARRVLEPIEPVAGQLDDAALRARLEQLLK